MVCKYTFTNKNKLEVIVRIINCMTSRLCLFYPSNGPLPNKPEQSGW